MFTRASARGGDFAKAAIFRPLNAKELGVAAAALLVVGTIYAVVWTKLDFHGMSDDSMPLWLSIWWAAGSLLPWVAAFEAIKRLSIIHALPLRLGVASCVILGAAVVSAWAQQMGCIAMGMGPSTLPMMVAGQLQPLLLFLALMIFRQGLIATAEGRPLKIADAEMSAIPSQVESIRAAGNYVELKIAGRTVMRRMTMRQAEAACDPARFIRIHRSLIVRRDLIVELTGNGTRPSLRLITGELLPVGDRYRHSVAQSVPSAAEIRHSSTF